VLVRQGRMRDVFGYSCRTAVSDFGRVEATVLTQPVPIGCVSGQVGLHWAHFSLGCSAMALSPGFSVAPARPSRRHRDVAKNVTCCSVRFWGMAPVL
jgi:hypothetical protein